MRFTEEAPTEPGFYWGFAVEVGPPARVFEVCASDNSPGYTHAGRAYFRTHGDEYEFWVDDEELPVLWGERIEDPEVET